MNKEKIITAITFIILIGAFVLGIYFIVRLVNKPGGDDQKTTGIMSGELKTYTHPDYGFSFDYPAEFKIGKFPEGEGEVILVQDATSPQPSPLEGEGANFRKGFQIFISLYEEKNPLSKAIIQESAPEMKISNDKEIEVGKDDITALSFYTESTREIWFVREGNLYQMTSYKEFGSKMEEILETLRFN